MFNGEEQVKISTDSPEEEFYEKAQQALESLGDVDVGSDGAIAVAPKGSLVSFLSTVTIAGKIRATDDGYKVNVQYDISPSTICWVAAVLAFCVTIVGAAIIVGPLLLDKPSVAKVVENALRDLKESCDTKKRRRASNGGE